MRAKRSSWNHYEWMQKVVRDCIASDAFGERISPLITCDDALSVLNEFIKLLAEFAKAAVIAAHAEAEAANTAKGMSDAIAASSGDPGAPAGPLPGKAQPE